MSSRDRLLFSQHSDVCDTINYWNISKCFNEVSDNKSNSRSPTSVYLHEHVEEDKDHDDAEIIFGSPSFNHESLLNRWSPLQHPIGKTTPCVQEVHIHNDLKGQKNTDMLSALSKTRVTHTGTHRAKEKKYESQSHEIVLFPLKSKNARKTSINKVDGRKNVGHDIEDDANMEKDVVRMNNAMKAQLVETNVKKIQIVLKETLNKFTDMYVILCSMFLTICFFAYSDNLLNLAEW